MAKNNVLPLTLPCAAAPLLPHQPPMLLVDRVLARDVEARTGLVAARLTKDSIFVGGDSDLLAEYLIELAAQAVAAINGYDGLLAQVAPQVGFLVGVDGWQCRQLPALGLEMIIAVEQGLAFGAITIFKVMIYQQDELLVQGELRVWQGEQLP